MYISNLYDIDDKAEENDLNVNEGAFDEIVYQPR